MNEQGLNICVVGTGYVGLTTGVCLATIGHQVTCIDKDVNKVATLNAGKSPIYEPGIEELIYLAKNRLTFTSEFGACTSADVIIMAVGTPPAPNGSADLSFLEAAIAEVAGYLGQEKLHIIVNKSTVPIGTAQRTKMLLENHLRRIDRKGNFAVVSNPEFLREGVAVHDTLYPDRIVIGSDSIAALNVMRSMYAGILEQTFSAPKFCPRSEGYQLPTLVTTDVTSAEMIKYAANAFLATKISFINEIGGLCEKVGADIIEVARGIGLDKRIGARFLQAGVGWGGSCFGKDTAALISTGREYSLEMPIVTAAITINKRQRIRIVEKLQDHLRIVRGRTIGVLGLAFKPETDDLRDAPALDIIQSLLEMGASVKVYDPIAMSNYRHRYPEIDVEYCQGAVETATGADALIVLTEWEEFRHLPYHRLAEVMADHKLLMDGRNIFQRDKAQQAGLTYVGFGR